jgi:exodeoxyribonuclease VII small subunit
MSDTKKPETFEAGLRRLETLVHDLENKSMDLDEAVSAFEEGKRLGDQLTKKISEAVARLETISRNPDGRPAIHAMPHPSPAKPATDDE